MAREKPIVPIIGRVVAITGGARGIGRATAEALIRKGARIAIGDLDLALAEQTAAELGNDTLALELDVTDRESFANFLDAVESQLGPVDVLINNAGIMPIGHFHEEPDDVSEGIIDINVKGVMTGTKLAIQRMLPRGRGHIVNIASQAGRAPFADLATYCASKHAVVGLTGALSQELEGTGVELSCVMPAIVNTELSAGMPNPRFVKKIEPSDVANGIVEALEQPRMAVYVPKSGGFFLSLGAALPTAGAKWLARVMHADNVASGADPRARAGYEDRARAAAEEAEKSV